MHVMLTLSVAKMTWEILFVFAILDFLEMAQGLFKIKIFLFSVTLFLISNFLKVVKLQQQARLQLLPLPTLAKLAMLMLHVKPI